MPVSRTFWSLDGLHSIHVFPDGGWVLSRSGYPIDEWKPKRQGRPRHTSERRQMEVAHHIFAKKDIRYKLTDEQEYLV